METLKKALALLSIGAYKSPMEKMTTVCFYVPKAMAREIRAFAKAEDLNLSQVLRRLWRERNTETKTK